MARKQLDAYNNQMAGRREKRRVPEPKQHDRVATDLPRGVLAAPALVPCPSGDGSVLRVVRNIRHDPIAAMLKRNQLDHYQAKAAEYWQRDWEAAQLGRVKAMNPMKEPVDGSPPRSDPINDRQRRALNAIRDADVILGAQGGIIVRLVLAECLSIGQVVQRYGLSTDRDKDRLGWLLRICLDELAKFYGLADKRLATCQAVG